MAVAICQSCQVTLEMYSDLKMTVNLKSLTETGKSGAYRSSTFMGAVTVVNNIMEFSFVGPTWFESCDCSGYVETEDRSPSR